jgi:hypothetical protein
MNAEREIDARKIIRLKAAIEGVLATPPKDTSPELANSYNLIRPQILSALPEGLQQEFNQLFDSLPVPHTGLGPDALMANIGLGHEARTRLHLLHGWLEGVLKD